MSNKYFNGKECVNGHLAERYVKSNACVECDKERHSGVFSVRSAAKRKVRDEFIEKHYRVEDKNFEFFASIVLAKHLDIFPGLLMHDLIVGGSFLVHPMLAEELFWTAENLMRDHHE